MPIHRPSPPITIAYLALFFVALVLPATASASDTLTITPPANPAAETTVPVVLSGESEGNETLEVYALTGASMCPPSLLELESSSSDPHYTDYSLFSKGSFAVTAGLEIKQAGTYLLCGRLGVLVTASAEMTVGPSAAEVQKTAEAKTRELAEQAPATFLSVKTVSHRLGSTAHPGTTRFEIRTNKYADVTVTVGNSWTREYRASGETKDLTFNWSCRQAGTHRYAVTATSGSGPTFTRSGRIRTVTSKWCASTKRGEERENGEVRNEERAEHEQIKHREEEDHRQEVERFDSNCEKLGGTPVELPTGEGRKTYCRGPNGGVIPVPH